MILFINTVISETGCDDHLELEVCMPNGKKFTQTEQFLRMKDGKKMGSKSKLLVTKNVAIGFFGKT